MNKLLTSRENLRESPDSGYTILEAMMAMVVVAVLMIAIAPVLVFATGTRVQARRVELATQAARTYINGVKSAAIPVATITGTTITPIIETKVLASTADRETFKVDAPNNAGLSCLNDGYCQSPTSLYCVNLDDDPGCKPESVKDMLIQAYRSIPEPPNQPDPRQGYLLGVRVYRADAFKSGVTLVADPQTQQQSTITGGIGNPSIPVVQMTTEIGTSSGAAKSSFQNLCDRLGCQ
ncbi:hormogonium polysaccharide secretion pseudopilin HpsB [Kamptonema animale CS-326]|jgi:type II secretory pathway pseudopilin PulG|uniref:hormogonium polysaccharide secretion pseudopilin HpsB n=1 Tax=Kamptonema animale TaxID=92934 RepID=UPI00232D2A4B|nr:hormogonium polysaccharide secretion pseudopilin HpsB [Kamptonema animale]MDB9510323.1 hormogonium polysaccharide secretion pseudopilin HpsB [Kamptonema animale CS-326]